MLADIWPTGYHATELAGVSPGDQTVIYGAGPVGLMASLSATVRGAGRVMVVDRHPDRLRLAESIGAIAIDDSKVDPVEAVLERTCGWARTKNGQVAFDYGLFWFKGQHIGSGQAPAKKYNRQLRDLIAAGKAEPSFIVSHELPLDEAPEAYEHFDARDEGWTKVVLESAMAGS